MSINSETPKNYSKQDIYTSPIGLLKNYNTVTNHNSYEEQFYKIKSQRLEAELNQMKQENHLLKSKLTDFSTSNQILKEKVYILENLSQQSFTNRTIPSFITDSGFPSISNSQRGSPESKYYASNNDKSERSNLNTEVERLVKQNRVLKNDHEMEITKFRDEIKKLNKRIQQLQLNKKSADADIQQKLYRHKQQQRYAKVEKANQDLRKDREELEKERKKLEERVAVLEETNKNIKKENQQLQILNSSNSRTKAALQDLQKEHQKRVQQHEEKVKSLQKQIQQIKKQLTESRSINQGSSEIQMDPIKQQKQIQLLKRKVCRAEQALTEKQGEITNILTKLKPLMEKQRGKRDQSVGDSNRASLSILQIFLKKYKINSF